MAVIDAYNVGINSPSILPTLALEINGKNIHSLKDGGCQSNLILESLAEDLELKVVQSDVKISVKGINSVKVHNTKIVECKLKIDNTEYIVEAICLTNISLSLQLPGMGKIFREFILHGYNLADSFLN